MAGQDVDPYRLFFLSLPANYYCWFALCLVLVCILRNFNPGSMGRYEFEAAQQEITPEAQDKHDSSASAHWLGAVIPLLVLIFSVPVNAYIIGADQLFPITATRFAEAYAQAERYVPQIMVLGAILAAAVQPSPVGSHSTKLALILRESLSRLFASSFSGIRDLAPTGYHFVCGLDAWIGRLAAWSCEFLSTLFGRSFTHRTFSSSDLPYRSLNFVFHRNFMGNDGRLDAASDSGCLLNQWRRFS